MRPLSLLLPTAAALALLTGAFAPTGSARAEWRPRDPGEAWLHAGSGVHWVVPTEQGWVDAADAYGEGQPPYQPGLWINGHNPGVTYGPNEWGEARPIQRAVPSGPMTYPED